MCRYSASRLRLRAKQISSQCVGGQSEACPPSRSEIGDGWWARRFRSFTHPTDLCARLCRNPRFRAIGQPRGNADGGAARRYVMLDERAGADLGEIADADTADDGRSGAEINAPADFRGAVRLRMLSAD